MKSSFRLNEGILAALLITIVIGLAAPFWDVPLSRDQGVYATCASVLLRGGTPITDCWDTKGPALHYTYALAQLWFGHNTAGPYILNAIAAALTGLVMAVLLTCWGLDRIVGYGAGLLYGLLLIAIRFDFNAQPESFANFFAMMGLLGLTYAAQSGRKSYYTISGMVLAFAVFYKYALLLPYGVAALAVLLTVAQRDDDSSRLSHFVLTLAGSLALVLIFALYLLARRALTDAVLHTRFIFFIFPKAQLNPDEFAARSRPLIQTLAYMGRLPLIWLLALAGCIWAGLRRRWYTIPLAAYIVAGIVVVWGQQRFTPYHWTAMLPALVLSIAALLHEIGHLSALNGKWRQVAAGLLAAAALINALTFFYVDQWLFLGPYLTGQTSQEAFYQEIGAWDHKIVAEYIQEHTDPGDPIWVWGHHTAIYFLADRPSPTRFIYNEPLLMHIRGGHPYQAQWQQKALDDIYADPPYFIVLTLFDRTFFDFQNPDEAWRSIPAYDQFLNTHYQMVFPYGRFQVWQLIPYWDRHNAAALLDVVTVVDLVEVFDQARIIQQVDPPIEPTTFSLPPEPAYDTLLMQSGGALAYQLDLPAGPVCLRFDAAMFPDSRDWGGDGASFVVEVQTADGISVLADFYVSNQPDDPHWQAHLIDLSDYGGQSITLILRTGPGPANDFSGDWAGWGQPRIVQPPAGSQCDTNAVLDTRTDR